MSLGSIRMRMLEALSERRLATREDLMVATCLDSTAYADIHRMGRALADLLDGGYISRVPYSRGLGVMWTYEITPEGHSRLTKSARLLATAAKKKDRKHRSILNILR